MWIVTDEGRVVNSDYLETIEIEERESRCVIVGQLHEVGAHARVALRRAFSVGPLDSPSRIVLANRSSRPSATDMLNLMLDALAENRQTFRVSRYEAAAVEDEETGAGSAGSDGSDRRETISVNVVPAAVVNDVMRHALEFPREERTLIEEALDRR